MNTNGARAILTCLFIRLDAERADMIDDLLGSFFLTHIYKNCKQP